ncbi:MAG TPA: hypothetical protein VFR81_22400 [Longimicrobium sp.]|nr:hypothetical protein [Longimicrobium sp.]
MRENDVTDPWELAARLAALHDREVDDREEEDDGEGEAVRRELASADPELLAAYAEAVAIAREHREADLAAAPPAHAGAAGTPVTPLRPRERAGGWRRPPARWIALAAVLAAVALVPLLRRGGPSSPDAGRFAALLQERGSGLPDDWSHRVGGTRGGGGEVAADTALAVELGALLLDLEVAAHAREGEETARLAGAVAERLASVSGSGPVAAVYRDIERSAEGPPEVLDDLLKTGREGVAAYFDDGLVEMGSWIEAARLAAHGRDAGFFASRESRNALEELAEGRSLDPAARAAADRVRAALPPGGPPAWPVLREALDDLMKELGG